MPHAECMFSPLVDILSMTESVCTAFSNMHYCVLSHTFHFLLFFPFVHSDWLQLLCHCPTSKWAQAALVDIN